MKKVLVLGASASEVSLVVRIKALGYFVVVTDNHADWSSAPAKAVANEAWNISYMDVDALAIKCAKERIIAIIPGYTEFRVEGAILLCRRLGLPCYSTLEQLEITRDKVRFKETCRKYSVPVIKEYATVDDVSSYPVIVKPADRASSIGISIAWNYEELKRAYEYAVSLSQTKRVIIEEYIQNKDKVDLYYCVQNGDIRMISSCDTIHAAENEGTKVVQSAWLYPSKHLELVKSKADAAIQNMIRGIGIKFGCIFYSGFALSPDEIAFFECGFRLEGGHQYGYVERNLGFNYLDVFINHALYGDGMKPLLINDVDNGLKCVTLNYYLKQGIVKAIKGFDEVVCNEDCTLSLKHAHVGQECLDNQAILPKLGMVSFVNQSARRLREDVEFGHGKIVAVDNEGRDMIFSRAPSDDVERWWE